MAHLALILASFASILLLASAAAAPEEPPDRARARDLGVKVGDLRPGPLNAITDVAGVRVGHSTLIEDEDVRTGATAILPHPGNTYQEKAPAAVAVFNAFGKAAGFLQVEGLGQIETPIILTNTLSVGTAIEAAVRYTLEQPGNEDVRSVNAVVGETNDGRLNDIRGRHVSAADVIRAIESAHDGAVEEGTVGAGTGTVAFGFKGGIGTSSRLVETPQGDAHTVGVLVQTNFGRSLRILGVPVGGELAREAPGGQEAEDGDGSCMIVIATDAPMSPRNLKRLAKRSFAAMARTTAVMSNGSGDFAIAFSTAWRIPHNPPGGVVETPPLVANSRMTRCFQAVEEATEEAIYNSLFQATPVTGAGGRTVRALPIEAALDLLRERGRIEP